MADPAQRDESPPADFGGPDRGGKIEQLLLSGLDHYFRGHFERAIAVWTRVLFLDRGHARAREYIDRARAAVAERHRESEALLHAGVEACDRGDVAEARTLLTTAVERGGAHDEALAVLDRVDRLAAAASREPAARARRRAGARRAGRGAATAQASGRRFRLFPWLLVVMLFMTASAALYVAGSWARLEPVRLVDQPGVAPVRGDLPPPVPLPSTSQLALERAEALVAGGRPVDALGVLATVGLGDALRGEVDTLRASIQRQVLSEMPGVPPGATAESGGPTGAVADTR